MVHKKYRCKKIIDNLFCYTGVIVFGSDQEVAELMKAVKRRNATGQFFWIGSDGWAARALVYEGEFKTYQQLVMVCRFKYLDKYDFT